MALSNQAHNRQNYLNEKKDATVVWSLWFFLGILGVHQFYLKNYKRGLTILIMLLSLLFVIGPILSVSGHAFLTLFLTFGITWSIWIAEAFYINNDIRKYNSKLAEMYRL